MFPDETDIVVLRAKKDIRGNPLPPEEIPRGGVLIAPRATRDPLDRSDVVDSNAVLYDADTAFLYLSTDRIRVPKGSRMAGDWSVDGRPGEWPSGSEVGLKRA